MMEDFISILELIINKKAKTVYLYRSFKEKTLIDRLNFWNDLKYCGIYIYHKTFDQ